jgi:hypothetical protein
MMCVCIKLKCSMADSQTFLQNMKQQFKNWLKFPPLQKCPDSMTNCVFTFIYAQLEQ